MESKREIIYVDAGSINSDNFRICLYHMNNNDIHIMELENIESNNDAEKYAIYHAILYIKKNNYNRCIVLSDNKGAIQDKTLLALSKDLHIQLSWIPREINTIADANCKALPTLDSSERNMLTLFVELSKKAYSYDTPVKSSKVEVEKHQQELEKLRLKVKNQATQINALRKITPLSTPKSHQNAT